ncbi:MAG: NrdH-redoxin [Bacteroidetes bacterium HGW-Bacteroidetes-4]|jgi:glutaredoxin-like YruB-family protein|nr:MAG: NrdH-redoxin [Bacteroidetes bacterium HGW-Bacteroidetes-4]
MKTILNYQELLDFTQANNRTYLLLYKSKNSSTEDCAYKNLTDAYAHVKESKVAVADVVVVRDIHEKFQVTSVPALIELQNGKLVRTIKGCHEPEYYKNILSGIISTPVNASGESKVQKTVVVYSTPSCSWCNTLKNYFKEHHIAFSDIDVSRNQKAAEEMVKRSGQQGVPQTLINGELIVGFDKARIDKLLQIQSK